MKPAPPDTSGRAARRARLHRRRRDGRLGPGGCLRRLDLAQLGLQPCHLVPGGEELTGLSVALTGGGDLPTNETESSEDEAVAFVQDAGGQRLLAQLEAAEAGGLRRDSPPRNPDPTDDADALIPDLLGERQAVEQIVEPVGVEHYAHDVRARCLVAVDELAREDILRTRRITLQLPKSRPRRARLCAEPQQLDALGVEVGLNRCDLTLQAADARSEPIDPSRRSSNGALEPNDAVLRCADAPLKLSRVGGGGGRGSSARDHGQDEQ